MSTVDSVMKWGLCPGASAALHKAGVGVERVGQTIGQAAASAGTHAADGYYLDVHGAKQPYCCATDIRIRDLSAQQIWDLLGKLSENGFAAFYRHPGFDHWPLAELPHVHAVYAGAPMKHLLRSQVHDYLATPTLNGLASHAGYQFFSPSQYAQGVIRTLFLAHNPPNG